MKPAQSTCHPAPLASQEIRTSGSEAPFCRQCGQEIHGRRRNGFCSDQCRMQCRRREARGRIEKRFDDIQAQLDALRREVLK